MRRVSIAAVRSRTAGSANTQQSRTMFVSSTRFVSRALMMSSSPRLHIDLVSGSFDLAGRLTSAPIARAERLDDHLIGAAESEAYRDVVFSEQMRAVGFHERDPRELTGVPIAPHGEQAETEYVRISRADRQNVRRPDHLWRLQDHAARRHHLVTDVVRSRGRGNLMQAGVLPRRSRLGNRTGPIEGLRPSVVADKCEAHGCDRESNGRVPLCDTRSAEGALQDESHGTTPYIPIPVYMCRDVPLFLSLERKGSSLGEVPMTSCRWIRPMLYACALAFAAGCTQRPSDASPKSAAPATDDAGLAEGG